ncbi:diguanylate cyclase [Shewanella submarina]|uniref:diguanylate cyclase n=1 Tax=Shewanella submarina TaxID=2016376 RepID=A0ABV7G736_9GAMM|nr:diguanylate cyclase [Shewanella submarina]MCL1037266.1 diguanylate cyclase [Shewanella submarina]
MKINIRSKVFLLFASLMAISVINFSLISSMAKTSEEDYNWVTHTHVVMQHGENLLGEIRDAETGQRGYLLTGDPRYLEPFFSGVQRSKQELKVLLDKTRDNTEQQQKLERIQNLIDDKLNELTHTITLYKAGKIEESIQLVDSDQGKQIMDEIRLEMDAFQAVEAELLKSRRDTYSKMQTAIQHTFILESLIFIAAMVGVLWYVNKSILRPLALLTKSARAYKFSKAFIPVQLSRQDEIGELATAFNHMGERVTRSRDALVDANQKTQSKLDDALSDATTDPLTGLKNRRYMHDSSRQLIETSISEQSNLSIILFDVDHFKHVNDNYGHASGDQVLKMLGRNIKASIRTSDIAVRYGGEEFVILLPDTGLNSAAAIAEGLRKSVESMVFPTLDGSHITISLGVAQLSNDETDINALFIRADKALYESKSNGRNRTSVADQLSSFPNIEI